MSESQSGLSQIFNQILDLFRSQSVTTTKKEGNMSSVSTSDIRIHPSVDNGVRQGRADFAGGTLTCKCATDPVKVEIRGQIAHNHACGCSKCWKPSGAVFSVVAVTPRENVRVVAN